MNEKKKKNDDYSAETYLIYGKAHTMKWDYNHHVIPPISSSTTYRLDSAQRGAQGFIEFAHTTEETKGRAPIYIYDRLGEPNKDILEENLAFAEKGEAAVTYATGMGAISAILGILTKSGDQILAHRTLYGCTFSLLSNWYPRYNIDVGFINLLNVGELEQNITEATRVVYFETPVNPTMEIIDIRSVCEVVAEYNKSRSPENRILTVVDNTFATPFCQRPLEFGADFVVHSLTKGIGGFGTDMGGAVIGPESARDMLLLYRKDFGAVLATKSAWPILVYGLPSLPVRMRQQQASAGTVAEFLCRHPKVESVNYPGAECFAHSDLAKKQMRDYHDNFAPGSLLYFTLKADSPQARKDLGEKLINYIAEEAYTITLAVSLGHTRTLIEHPGSMTHSAIPPEEQLARGLDPGGIRLSIGLEQVDDIIKDLGEALEIV
ncbi:MAG: cystathionine gamma-lyase [Chlorobi bacterium]|nr:cystathionine gamma-lyase [Chlorobiota bacterium]